MIHTRPQPHQTLQTTQKKGPQWVNWAGKFIPDDDVIELTHKNERKKSGWHAYTEQQIEAVLEIAAALHKEYKFKDILGHDDIAPTRKVDPGPAFAMNSFRSAILGRQ